MTRHERALAVTLQTLEYRDLKRSYLPFYRVIIGFRPTKLSQKQQIALYHANTISTCYLSTIMNSFGQQLRRVINRILNVNPEQIAGRPNCEDKAMCKLKSIP
jgi:catechol-2,3-dioxygenase